MKYLESGASHVVVTSFVFRDGKVDMDRLNALLAAVGGKDKVVLDLSCRQDPARGGYYVVTDRWQKFTDVTVDEAVTQLSAYCAEFLVHGVDVEGMRQGIVEPLVELLAEKSPIPVTYAGGIRSLEDMELVKRLGKGRVDATIGSALDMFGGDLSYAAVVEWHRQQQQA
mmetsp:Transcript_51349/g.135335  ORF Transcript_51349/g.135335 Transcript_51349/m.135335 type:complete len:169 (+) Transcript_51349:309-815(+)